MASMIPDYDTTHFSIDTLEMSEAIVTIAGADPTNPTGLLGDAIAKLGDIITTAQNLQLSWVGDAADAAQDFIDQWNAASTDLFGTEQDPKLGVFPRLVDCLLTAVANYDHAEQVVSYAFGGFADLGTSTGDSGNHNVVNTAGAEVKTAITEIFAHPSP